MVLTLQALGSWMVSGFLIVKRTFFVFKSLKNHSITLSRSVRVSIFLFILTNSWLRSLLSLLTLAKSSRRCLEFLSGSKKKRCHIIYKPWSHQRNSYVWIQALLSRPWCPIPGAPARTPYPTHPVRTNACEIMVKPLSDKQMFLPVASCPLWLSPSWTSPRCPPSPWAGDRTTAMENEGKVAVRSW